MSHTRTTCFLAAVLLACPAYAVFKGPFVHYESAAERSDNLVRNGGFEKGGALPAWWRRHPPKDNDRNLHARDTKVFHSGHASARIEWWDPIAGKNKAPLQWNRYGLSVRGGSALIASGFVRTRGVQPAGAGLHFYDAAGNHVGFRRIPAPADVRDWAPFCAQVPVPERAVKAGFVLYTRQGGVTWYDDVVLLGIPHYDARRGTPEIDGRLDDPCWRPEAAVSEFIRHDGAGPGKEPTRAWVVYDDAALCVAFDCPHPPGARLKAEATQHDGKTWLDDSIEVFLAPWRTRSGYEHIMVNCMGVVRDAFGQLTQWESGVKVGVRREDRRWTVELRIPFDHLGLNLDTGPEWGMNLVRNDRIHGETVTWSLGAFHDPSRFGTVRIEPDITPWIADKLREAVAERQAASAGLRKELTAAKLTRKTAPRAWMRVDQAAAALAGVQALLAEASAMPRARLESIGKSIREIDAALKAARRDALAALFRAGPPDAADGFHVLPVHSMVKVPQTGTFDDVWTTRVVRLTAARDEAESFQLVIEPGENGVEQVTTDPCELRGPTGARIPLQWSRVLYVETAAPRAYRAPYVGWWPDILAPPAPFDVPRGQRRPVWCRVVVPADAQPGVYRGRVTVRAGGRRVSIPIELTVRSFRLPRPGTLPCAFGLYAWVLSEWYHGRKPYQDVMPVETFARWCRFLGEYRLTPKNVGNEYRKKTEDGWDLSALRKTIGELAPKYYPPYSFCIYRLPCPRDVQIGKTKRDPRVWIEALTQIAEEYRRLGLPREAYVYGVDEPAVEGYPFLKKVYAMVREAVPDFPIMQTVNHDAPAALAGQVGIWCPLSAKLESDYDFYRSRMNAGDRVWMYVCCGPKPPYANFFVDQPGIDHRVLFWQAWQKGVTGILYWCVCYWRGIPGPPSGQAHFPDAPIRLSQSGVFKNLGVNGDGILVWPGPDMTPWPSQRIEIIRDGIEDYEYLALLDRCTKVLEAEKTKRTGDDALLRDAASLRIVPKDISRSFVDFCKDPAILLARRRRIADCLERMKTRLGARFPERPR